MTPYSFNLRHRVVRSIRMISVEIYHGIVFDSEVPQVSALAHSEHAIVVNSFSKYYSMPGWRLGWMVVPEYLAAGVRCIDFSADYRLDDLAVYERWYGEHDDPENTLNAIKPLLYKGKQVGSVIRTRVDVKPLYISAGHKIDLESAVELVSATTRGYRLPEPMRVAHILSNKMRRNHDSRQSGAGPRRSRRFG